MEWTLITSAVSDWQVFSLSCLEPKMVSIYVIAADIRKLKSTVQSLKYVISTLLRIHQAPTFTRQRQRQKFPDRRTQIGLENHGNNSGRLSFISPSQNNLSTHQLHPSGHTQKTKSLHKGKDYSCHPIQCIQNH